MVNRRQIRGVAAGIAGKFCSRNNDINGYWAMGILYSAAIRSGTSIVKIDLLTKKCHPHFKYARNLAVHFEEYLFLQLKKIGFEEFQIAEATIELTFGLEDDLVSSVLCRNTWGDSYSCKVLLKDDLGISRIFVAGGWCGPHDPEREHRSTRAFED